MSGTTRKLIESAATAPPSSYESYYGLVEPPFSLTPGLRFAYNSHSHRTALSQVRQALERREGLIAVTGEVGTGKTMLCRALTQDSNTGSFVSLVLDPCLSAEEILEHVLTDFGVMNEEVGSFGRLAPAVPRHQMLILLQRFLASLIPLGGRAVVVIDEAQHLRPEVLEQIRLWSNFETNDTKLLQIVLAGQSELDEILRRPEMRQIQQRISRRCELTPLSAEEVAEYIEHRLWVARGFEIEDASETETHRGAEAPRARFTPAACAAVAVVSGGIPRLVNLLCDRALEVGCDQQAQNIDKDAVAAGARRLNLTAPVAQPEAAAGGSALRLPAMPRLTPRLGFAAAAVLLLIAAPFFWRERSLMASAPAVAPVQPAVSASETLQTQAVLNVTVATFESESRAKAVAASLLADGYPAFTRREPGSRSYRLIIGPYVSAEAAAAARGALAEHGVEGRRMQIANASAGFSADVRYQKPATRGSDPTSDPTPGPTSDPTSDPGSYRAAVKPAIERLERLMPFLRSAASDSSAPVLKALEGTLTELRQSVADVAVPEDSRHTHQLLTSALSTASDAVAQDFSGDRAAKTREALLLLDQAKSGL